MSKKILKTIFNENHLIEDKNNERFFKLDTCIGNDLLNEINPTNKKMEKSSIINVQIDK